jgi:hypothetical protein
MSFTEEELERLLCGERDFWAVRINTLLIWSLLRNTDNNDDIVFIFLFIIYFGAVQ